MRAKTPSGTSLSTLMFSTIMAEPPRWDDDDNDENDNNDNDDDDDDFDDDFWLVYGTATIPHIWPRLHPIME